ncbi:acyloxyacyl hydrolase [Phocaeicola sp.]|uniref:acyloxyacyl hydrolase n=1 Tax=Phocaeicola sp. TaxID=2773926 RepID=UPI00307BAFD7
MKKTDRFILLCLLFAFFCIGETLAGHAEPDSLTHHPIHHQIGFDIRPGYVLPTKSFFEGENAQGKPINTVLSAHLKYAFRFDKDSYLGKLYPHAYQGIGIAYTSFFNPSELGNPVSVYVFQGSQIARLTPHLTLDYEWNFGASFGWKKYNETSNPYNDVVGSKINAYLNAGIYLNWQLAPQWHLTAGIETTHYSNGNSNYPNSGVNTVGGRIGLIHTFGAEKTTPKTHPQEKALLQGSPFSYDIILYGATRRRGIIWPDERYLVPGSFGVIGFNFNPLYRVNRYFRAGISLDAQYDESANLKNHVAGTEHDTNQKQFYRPSFREQFAVGLSLRAELTMPIFSINLGIGRNLIYKGEDTKGFYQILALKTFVTRRAFLHVGYQLSNFRDPNNLMLGLGYRF